MLKKLTSRQIMLALTPLIVALALMLVVMVTCQNDQVKPPPMPPVASETVVITPSASVPNDEPSIRGIVTRLTNSAEGAEALIEYFPEDPANPKYIYDKVLVKMDEFTAVDSDNATIATLSTLAVGSTVEVWFSEPSIESYPVMAYGHAIRVITAGDAIDGMKGLPKMTVTGSSKSLAGIVSTRWPSRGYEYDTTIGDMLSRMRGAYIIASPGSTLALGFSSNPKVVNAEWSKVKSSSAKWKSAELDENNQIVIPEDARGELFYRIKCDWSRGTVTYGFSVSIVEQG